MNDDVKARLLATFRAQADDHLAAMTSRLLALEQAPAEADKALLGELFREMHTLKGAARSVSLEAVESLCQAAETLLSRLTRGQQPFTGYVRDLLQETLDTVALLVAGETQEAAGPDIIARLQQATAGGPGAWPASAAARSAVQAGAAAAPLRSRAAPRPGAEFVRVDVRRLDEVLFQAEELLLAKLAAAERVYDARDLAERFAGARAAFARFGAGAGGDRELADLESTCRRLDADARALLAKLARDQRAVRAGVDSLDSGLLHLRTIPAGTMFEAFPRMMRDIAAAQGKEIDWAVEGADLPVDRKVLEAVREPLLHTLRNAIDHGIEPPAERVCSGKPRRGRLYLRVGALEGGRIAVEVEDDGAGIHPAAVATAAVRAGLISEAAASEMDEAEAIALLFRPGFSTRQEVDKLSGHGLGLAIARERVEALGGRVEFSTAAGSGTRLRFILPTSVATARGLLVRAVGQRFMFPLECVEHVVRVDPGTVRPLWGRDSIPWKDQAIPAVSLAEILGSGEAAMQEDRRKRPAVVMASGAERLAVIVDEAVGVQEVQVKKFAPPLVRLRHIASAALLGTGELALILRPGDLVLTAAASVGLGR